MYKPVLYQFKALVFKERGHYIAQFLGVDICTQSRDVLSLIQSIQYVIRGWILLGKKFNKLPFSDLNPPPGEFWRRYYDAWSKDVPSWECNLVRQVIDIPEGLIWVDLAFE